MGYPQTPQDVPDGFTDTAWSDVISAMDRTYSELVAYQEKLETQNADLNEMQRFMDSVFSSVSDVLIVVGRSSQIAQTSKSFDALFGSCAGVLRQGPIAEVAAPECRENLQQAIAEVIATRDLKTIEIDVVAPDGPAPLELSIAPRLNERGKSVGAVIVGRPVGELRRAYCELEQSHAALKEAQAHLVRNEKLASLGRLVAGVAHELNNPISFVYANTHALEKYAARFEAYFDAVQDGAAREDLMTLRSELSLDRTLKNLRLAVEGAREGAQRVREIVEDLRRLSSDGSGEVVDFDLVTTSRTAADWVVRGTETPVKLVFEEGPRPVARGNPGHIQQIVMNLVQNAIDALADVRDPHITLRHMEQGERAVLMVCDNGAGVAADHLEAIFDPFFTTKPVGKGTGLGLSISHKIAQEHGGDLRYYSIEEGGCFCLDLPLGQLS
jgi:two-component system sensor histidine kinase HupT/HoxJ